MRLAFQKHLARHRLSPATVDGTADNDAGAEAQLRATALAVGFPRRFFALMGGRAWAEVRRRMVASMAYQLGELVRAPAVVRNGWLTEYLCPRARAARLRWHPVLRDMILDEAWTGVCDLMVTSTAAVRVTTADVDGMGEDDGTASVTTDGDAEAELHQEPGRGRPGYNEEQNRDGTSLENAFGYEDGRTEQTMPVVMASVASFPSQLSQSRHNRHVTVDTDEAEDVDEAEQGWERESSPWQDNARPLRQEYCNDHTAQGEWAAATEEGQCPPVAVRNTPQSDHHATSLSITSSMGTTTPTRTRRAREITGHTMAPHPPTPPAVAMTQDSLRQAPPSPPVEPGLSRSPPMSPSTSLAVLPSPDQIPHHRDHSEHASSTGNPCSGRPQRKRGNRKPASARGKNAMSATIAAAAAAVATTAAVGKSSRAPRHDGRAGPTTPTGPAHTTDKNMRLLHINIPTRFSPTAPNASFSYIASLPTGTAGPALLGTLPGQNSAAVGSRLPPAPAPPSSSAAARCGRAGPIFPPTPPSTQHRERRRQRQGSDHFKPPASPTNPVIAAAAAAAGGGDGNSSAARKAVTWSDKTPAATTTAMRTRSAAYAHASAVSSPLPPPPWIVCPGPGGRGRQRSAFDVRMDLVDAAAAERELVVQELILLHSSSSSLSPSSSWTGGGECRLRLQDVESRLHSTRADKAQLWAELELMLNVDDSRDQPDEPDELDDRGDVNATAAGGGKESGSEADGSEREQHVGVAVGGGGGVWELLADCSWFRRLQKW